jgi:hypothetical protein
MYKLLVFLTHFKTPTFTTSLHFFLIVKQFSQNRSLGNGKCAYSDAPFLINFLKCNEQKANVYSCPRMNQHNFNHELLASCRTRKKYLKISVKK